MKGILVIPEQEETPCSTIPCLLLFPVMDRPFLQHIVEAIAGRGVTDIQIVLGQGAEAIVRFLGDGTRWGCSFSYHLVSNPERPASVLRALAAEDERMLIARADQLPMLPNALPEAERGTLFGTPNAWSGWAIVDSRELRQSQANSLAELGRYLAAHASAWSNVGSAIVLRSIADIPDIQRRFLQKEVPGAITAAREVEPGVWVAANAKIAPTATLQAPVFVGENAVVSAGVRLGPCAVVGPNCLLDRDSNVHDSTVCGSTYVGTGVELDGVLVAGRSLLNPRQNSVTTLDPRLLDRITPALSLPSGPWRVLAAAAFVLVSPIVLAAAFWLAATRPGPVFWYRRFVRFPSSTSEAAGEMGTAVTMAPPRSTDEEYGWIIPATFRGLILELLPALLCVASGSLRLVGLPPRSRTQLRAHSAQCPAIARTSPGLISEVALCGAERLSPEDCLLVDAYQTQTSRPLTNLRRVLRFLYKAFTVWGTDSHDPTAKDAELVPTASGAIAQSQDFAGAAVVTIAQPAIEKVG